MINVWKPLVSDHLRKLCEKVGVTRAGCFTRLSSCKW